MKQFVSRWFIVLGVGVEASGVNSVSVMKLDRCSGFVDVIRTKYIELQNLSASELVDCFCKCSTQGNRAAVSSEICSALDEIAKNEIGKETLRNVVARLYPFISCAQTLSNLVDKIPVIPVKGKDKLAKAKKVILLMDALGVRSECVAACFSSFNTRLNNLKSAPVIFPDASEKYRSGSLLEVFKCDSSVVGKKKKQEVIIDQLNSYWDVQVKRVVDDFVSLLRFGIFSLELGPTRYEYESSTNHYVISFSNRKISARCITGPFLIDEIDSVRLPPLCCFMDDREISVASGLHHEIFHHLVIGIEGDGFGSFSRLAAVLMQNGIDSSYIRYLKDIYTDADEFRTITGLFVNEKGELYFDPCSEGMYLHMEGKTLRGTHKSGFRAVHVPISFVHLLESCYGSLNLDRREKLDHGRIEWYS